MFVIAGKLLADEIRDPNDFQSAIRIRSRRNSRVRDRSVEIAKKYATGELDQCEDKKKRKIYRSTRSESYPRGIRICILQRVFYLPADGQSDSLSHASAFSIMNRVCLSAEREKNRVAIAVMRAGKRGRSMDYGNLGASGVRVAL